jgi:hypothetical protein
MEIKFKLDTGKAARATAAVMASYALVQVSKGTKYPQLAFASSIALIIIIAILYSNRPALLAKKHTPLVCEKVSQQPTNMNADAITCLFKEAYDTFPPLEGKPTNNNLLTIRETLVPLLMVIPYDQLLGVHSLTAILMETTKYKANHGASKFIRPSRLPLYNRNIANNTTTIVHVCAKAAHKSCLNDYASYKAAECGITKFLCDVVDKICYNNLKDAKTFYTKLMALEIMDQLDANSGGLYAIDMIFLRSNMTQYYVQADGIPKFIVMMEDDQKKAKRAGIPIADVELVMMASAAILAAQHFPP